MLIGWPLLYQRLLIFCSCFRELSLWKDGSVAFAVARARAGSGAGAVAGSFAGAVAGALSKIYNILFMFIKDYWYSVHVSDNFHYGRTVLLLELLPQEATREWGGVGRAAAVVLVLKGGTEGAEGHLKVGSTGWFLGVLAYQSLTDADFSLFFSQPDHQIIRLSNHQTLYDEVCNQCSVLKPSKTEEDIPRSTAIS